MTPISPAAGLAPRVEELANLKQSWGLIFLLGLVSVVVGMLAIGSTFIATLASVKVFGFLLVIAGGAEVIHSIVGRSGRSFALHLLAAALYLLVGIFILEDPIEAARVITLIMAASFLVGGALRLVSHWSNVFRHGNGSYSTVLSMSCSGS